MSPFWRSPRRAQFQLLGRGQAGMWRFWSFAVLAPYPQLGALARAWALGVARWAESWRQTVGWVGLEGEEPPVLLSFAPQRDLLARHFLRACVENPQHTAPQLWCLLQPGCFLAEAVNPYAPFAGSLEEVQHLLEEEKVSQVLRLQPAFLANTYRLSGVWWGNRESCRWAFHLLARGFWPSIEKTA